MFVLVEEVQGKYEGCEYKILGCFTEKEDALRESSVRQYRYKCKSELQKILKESYPRDTYYPVFSVVKGEEPTEVETPLYALTPSDKERVDAELSELREQALEFQKRQSEKEEKDGIQIEHLRCYIKHFHEGDVIPKRIKEIGPLAALRSQDSTLCEWVRQHLT